MLASPNNEFKAALRVVSEVPQCLQLQISDLGVAWEISKVFGNLRNSF